MSTIDRKLTELEIELPTRIEKGKGYVLAVEHAGLVYLTGHGPQDLSGKNIFTGRVGSDVTPEEGYLAARQVGIQLLRTLKDHLGTLDRVDRFVKVLAFVNSADDFHQQHLVVHGFSDLMTEVFGTRGLHARSAIGTSNLPNNMPVEVEAIIAIRD